MQLLITAAVWIAMPQPLSAEPLLLNGDSRIVEQLRGVEVHMTGASELHVTDKENPIQQSRIDLESEDAWLFFDTVKPSMVINHFLDSIRVGGVRAEPGRNVRVVQYGEGAVVIPHPEDFRPLDVYTAAGFTGVSRKLEQYLAYDPKSLDSLNDSIRSFRLKRGYMATFAENEDGTGTSKVYVAQDYDIDVPVLPRELDSRISFIRVFPWRWTSKKGGANLRHGLNLGWWYNWNLNEDSTPDLEYVAIRQNAYWPGLEQDWKKRGINHLLGYNEPDKNDQANMSVEEAIKGWPLLLKTGLRLGSPAVTDGGRDRWLYPFLQKAREKNYRVDFVAIHYYWSYWNPADPEGAARQFIGFLKSVHDRTGLPIWITEWNNGANWTNNDHDPSPKQQRDAIEAIIRMLDETPWVERYAIYNWVEDFRRVQWNDGSLTAAGEVYRDKISPFSYRQQPPERGGSSDAIFLFNHDFTDATGNGNNARPSGNPKFTRVGSRTCLELDGAGSCLRLPARSRALFDEGSAFTFAGWIRWAGGDGRQRIFDFSDGHGDGFSLTPGSASSLEFTLRQGGVEKRLSTKELKPGAWTHVAVTVDGSRGKLYVNGSPVRESPSMTIGPNQLATSINYIGRGADQTLPFFRGQMFDVRFLTKSLSDQDIRNLAARVAPAFKEEVLRFGVTVGMGLSGSLSGSAEGGTGTLAYAKAAGPDWLNILPDGALEGRPDESDLGENLFIVTVRDDGGRLDARTMIIDVRSR